MNMQPKTVLTDLSLDNGWMLIRAGEARPLSVGLLIDIHSVLLTQGVIVEPYWLDLDRYMKANGWPSAALISTSWAMIVTSWLWTASIAMRL